MFLHAGKKENNTLRNNRCTFKKRCQSQEKQKQILRCFKTIACITANKNMFENIPYEIKIHVDSFLAL